MIRFQLIAAPAILLASSALCSPGVCSFDGSGGHTGGTIIKAIGRWRLHIQDPNNRPVPDCKIDVGSVLPNPDGSKTIFLVADAEPNLYIKVKRPNLSNDFQESKCLPGKACQLQLKTISKWDALMVTILQLVHNDPNRVQLDSISPTTGQDAGAGDNVVSLDHGHTDVSAFLQSMPKGHQSLTFTPAIGPTPRSIQRDLEWDGSRGSVDGILPGLYDVKVEATKREAWLLVTAEGTKLDTIQRNLRLLTEQKWERNEMEQEMLLRYYLISEAGLGIASK